MVRRSEETGVEMPSSRYRSYPVRSDPIFVIVTFVLSLECEQRGTVESAPNTSQLEGEPHARVKGASDRCSRRR